MHHCDGAERRSCCQFSPRSAGHRGRCDGQLHRPEAVLCRKLDLEDLKLRESAEPVGTTISVTGSATACPSEHSPVLAKFLWNNGPDTIRPCGSCNVCFVPLRRLPSGALRLDEGIIGNAVQSRDVPNAVRLTGPQDATDRQVREGVGPDDAKSEDRPDETGAGEGRR